MDAKKNTWQTDSDASSEGPRSKKDKIGSITCIIHIRLYVSGTTDTHMQVGIVCLSSYSVSDHTCTCGSVHKSSSSYSYKYVDNSHYCHMQATLDKVNQL